MRTNTREHLLVVVVHTHGRHIYVLSDTYIQIHINTFMYVYSYYIYTHAHDVHGVYNAYIIITHASNKHALTLQ